MSHLIHALMHPHGWWILLDVALFGATTTLAIVAANDDDGGST